jgi:hypothetical protein
MCRMKKLHSIFAGFAVMEGDCRVGIYTNKNQAEDCLNIYKRNGSNGEPLLVVPIACKPILPKREQLELV